jgi:hypothetical protein
MACSRQALEVYYKDFDNLIEYAEGAEPANNGNTNYDTQLVFGDGYSYGAELFIKKRTGQAEWLGGLHLEPHHAPVPGHQPGA